MTRKSKVPGTRRRVVARPTGRPVKPIEVMDATGMVVYDQAGNVRDAVEISFSEHDVGRIREGYICINCLEDLDTAFPDECPICHFPMRERQAEVYATAWQGEKWLGPETSDEEELLIMQDMRLQEAFRKKILVPKPSIIVPRSL